MHQIKSIKLVKFFLFVTIYTFTLGHQNVAAEETANSDPSQLVDQQQSDDSPKMLKKAWKNMNAAWGKRSELEDFLSYQNALHQQQQQQQVPDYYDTELDRLNRFLLVNSNSVDNVDDDLNEPQLAEKRAWKNMNAAWGKRVGNGPNDWNKFRGSWGKREPGWNNLKGLWGKRSSANWNKLQSAWGK